MGKHASTDTQPIKVQFIEKPVDVDVKQPGPVVKQPYRWRKYTKGIVAIAGAVGVALTPFTVGDGAIDLPEAIQAGVALLTALGVIGFKNKKRNDVL